MDKALVIDSTARCGEQTCNLQDFCVEIAEEDGYAADFKVMVKSPTVTLTGQTIRSVNSMRSTSGQISKSRAFTKLRKAKIG